MQASTQQVFRDLLSKMGDQGRKKLTILLLGELPTFSRALNYVLVHEEVGLFREQCWGALTLDIFACVDVQGLSLPPLGLQSRMGVLTDVVRGFCSGADHSCFLQDIFAWELPVLGTPCGPGYICARLCLRYWVPACAEG